MRNGERLLEKMRKKMFEKIKNLFKEKKEVVTPYIRGFVIWTKLAKIKGLETDISKTIIILEGNKVIREYPYDEILVENLEHIEKIPIDDLTVKPTELITKEEISPGELKFEK